MKVIIKGDKTTFSALNSSMSEEDSKIALDSWYWHANSEESLIIKEVNGQDVFTMNNGIYESLTSTLSAINTDSDNKVSRYISIEHPGGAVHPTEWYFVYGGVYYIDKVEVDENDQPTLDTIIIPCTIGYDLVEHSVN